MSVNLNDLSNLVKALELTVMNVSDNNQLKQAEEFLKQSQCQENYCIGLMMIINQQEQQVAVRQAALVQLKLAVEHHWKHTKQDNYVIQEEEKLKIKASILDALIMTVDQPKLSVIYEHIIYKVMEHERDNWQGFYGMILQKLQAANTFNQFHGALMALRQINRNFHLFLDSARKPLEEIVPSCFPLLELYMVKLLNNYNDQTAYTLHVVLKIFYEANQLVLTDYLKNSATNLDKWMDLINQVAKLPLPPALLSPLQDHSQIITRCKNIHFKNQKIVGKILTRFIQKHANIRFDDKSDFPQIFEQKYCLGFLQMQLESLFQLENNQFVSPKVVHYALKYIYYGVSKEAVVQALSGVMDRLMFGIVLRLTFLTPHDEQVWKEDPEEYVRKEEDITQLSSNNKNMALDLLEKLCQLQNTSCLVNCLKYFHAVVTTNNDPYTQQPVSVLLREAVFRALGHLKTQVLGFKAFDVEELLVKYVIPEFSSQVGFCRATACWVFGKYGGKNYSSVTFKDNKSIEQGVKGITDCLKDSELPVRVKAAVSLSSLLEHQEAEDMLRPYLQTILECYLKLMDSIDNEGVVAALENIVSTYHNEIVPYSYQLINHLVAAFQKLCQKQQNRGDDDEDGDDGESELTAAGCLEAIRRILLSPLPEHTYGQVEGLLLPVFNYCLCSEGCDYIEEGLGCLNLILFNQQTLSPQIWFYYPLLMYILVGLPSNVNVQQTCLQKGLSEEQTRCLEDCKDSWGTDHLEMMLGCIKNFIQKGQASFLQQQDLFGQSFYFLLDSTIKRIYQIGANSESDYDMIVATTLYICVLENYPQQIDQLVPDIIDTVYTQGILQAKTKKLSALCIQVVAMALYYDVHTVLSYLQQKQWVDDYFAHWFKILPSFNKDFDKMRMMYGLVSLLKVQEQCLASNLYGGMPQMIKQLVKLSGEILVLREQDDSDDSEAQEITSEQEQAQIQDTLNKLDKYNRADGDNDSEFDMEEFQEGQANQYYISPLEEQDEILYFQETLQAIATHNQQYYQYLISNLDQQELEQLKNNFQEAQKQFDLYLQNKKEEEAKKQQQNQVKVL